MSLDSHGPGGPGGRLSRDRLRALRPAPHESPLRFTLRVFARLRRAVPRVAPFSASARRRPDEGRTSEKNYRLQDIQLSKSGARPGFRQRARLSVRAGPRPLCLAMTPGQGPQQPAVDRSRSVLESACLSAFAAQRQLRRDNRRAQPRAKAGGEYRARTGDLLVANQALSQLS